MGKDYKLYNIRPYSKSDYPTLTLWSGGWNLPQTPESWIPRNSFVVYKEEPICIGFMYQLDNTPMYWIEGIISNPLLESSVRKEALDVLIKHCEAVCKDLHGEIILSSTPRSGLEAVFKQNRFYSAPEKYSHIGKVI